MKYLNALLITSLLGATACELELPNPNNPAVPDTPTATEISQAATGMLVATRSGKAGNLGRVSAWGVFGRESRLFDGADPRFWTELVGPPQGTERPMDASTLDPNSFGGGFWTVPYRAIQQAQLFLDRIADGTPGADVLPAAETAAVRGFFQWGQALALEELVVSHICPPAIASTEPLCSQDTQLGFNDFFFIGVVLDWEEIDFTDSTTYTAEALNANAPLVGDWDTALARVDDLLASAAADFAAAGDIPFPFPLTSGYAGFGFGEAGTVAQMLPAVAAMRARVALYRDDFDGALAFLDESFIDEDPANFAFADGGAIQSDLGVFHFYSTLPGDVQNSLAPATTGPSPTMFVHSDIIDLAEVQGPDTTGTPGEPDLRLLNRTAALAEPFPGPDERPNGERVWTVYSSLESSIPIIRNEELVLIKIEALARQSTPDFAAALTLANALRTTAGGLAPLAADALDDEAEVIEEVLGQRRLSLGFQGGHRWVDTKRTGRLDLVSRDFPTDAINLVYPISPNETNARELVDQGEE